MATTTDINAIPMPELSDIANIETAVQPSIEAIDLLLTSRFNSVSERNSTITSPQFGMISIVETTGEVYMYDGTNWVSLRPRFFHHTVTQGNGSDSYIDVNDFSVPVEANSKYLFTGSIVVSTDSVTVDADIKFQWTYPAGVSGDWILYNASPGQDGPTYSEDIRISNREWTSEIGAAATYTVYYRYALEGLLITSATAGNMQMQFAQNVNRLGASYVMQESYLRVEKVA